MQDEILDTNEEAVNVRNLVAPKGTRFGNLLLDSIIAGIPISCLSNYLAIGTFAFMPDNHVSLQEQMNSLGINYVLLTLYFILTEHLFGKSIGKMITGTKVVNHRGQKPTLGQIIGRAFSRLIPLEAFSFLGESGIGWHDSLTSTYVIKEK